MTLYKVKLTPLTPVHIGSGDEIFSYEYRIFKVRLADGNESYRYVRFNPASMLQALGDAEIEKFKDSIGSMVSVRKFFHERVKYKDSPGGYLHPPLPATELAYRHYNDKLPMANNALELRTFIRPPGGNAYIPGSTLKGALRGAWLHAEWMKKNRESTIRYSHDNRGHVLSPPKQAYQPHELLGIDDSRDLITRDPFKIFKVGDTLEPIKTMVMLAEGVSWKKEDQSMSKLSAIQTLTEYIPGLLTHQTDSSATVRVAFDNVACDLWKLPIKLTWGDNKDNDVVARVKPLTDAILAADEKFYAKGGAKYRDALDVTREVMRVCKESKDKAGVCVTRIGWGSGFDSMSLNTATDDPMFVLSRKLADGRWPHGWVKLEQL